MRRGCRPRSSTCSPEWLGQGQAGAGFRLPFPGVLSLSTKAIFDASFLIPLAKPSFCITVDYLASWSSTADKTAAIHWQWTTTTAISRASGA
jgi:hypothetical protein